ncbi:TPA: hypothetical protein I8Y81_003001 [Legionella pneumophila]|uniref:Uncharacterized protein n=1 Tax=Legionella pneumophila TaxID=446 RepID=A0AAN5KSC5_LEGPN|nr:hypothetical protein [Legionella pneumophila]HAT1973143.1 hypothetical protein [Legionella pneumophila]HBC0465808.1 hypothetical protein [Legionella pneumophila]HDP0036511.1 hypothetical protein [Legionella pneumophila]HEN4771118.1 hypothetical protein [Legionella pneumophila]
MCRGKLSCLCHLLRPAIDNDKKEKLKSFFQKSLNTELYHFLKASYELQEQDDDEAFRASLRYLVTMFINHGAQQINLSYNNKHVFMTHYEAFIEGECTKVDMLKALTTLVQYIEKLSYLNLGTLDGFKDYLYQYHLNKDDKIENDHNHKTPKCALF